MQVLVKVDTLRRIKAKAGAEDCEPGEVIDRLAESLPPVQIPKSEGK